MKFTPLNGRGCGIAVEGCIVAVPKHAFVIMDAEALAEYTKFEGEHCDAIMMLDLRAGRGGGGCIAALLVEAKYAQRSISSYIVDYARYKRGESPKPSLPGFIEKIPRKLSLCAKLLTKLLNPRYTPSVYLIAVAIPDPWKAAVNTLEGIPGHIALRIVEEASRSLLGVLRDRAIEACKSLEGESYSCKAGIIACGRKHHKLEKEFDRVADDVCAASRSGIER